MARTLQKGLVVTAHADDAEYGCSGTVARLISEGWDFAYVLCTDGSKGVVIEILPKKNCHLLEEKNKKTRVRF